MADEKSVDTGAQVEDTKSEIDYDAEFQAMVAKRGLDGEEPITPAPTEQDNEGDDALPVATPEKDDAQKDEKVDKADEPKVDDKKDDGAPAKADDQKAATPSAPAAKDGDNDEVAKLRDQVAKLEQSNRSMAGRVSAFQRKYEEAAGKRPADVKTAEAAEQGAEWSEFEENFPEIAKGMKAALAAKNPDASHAELLEWVQAERQRRFYTEAHEAVEAVHPGWRDTTKTEEFKTWVAGNETRQKFASSDNIDEAIMLLDLYAAHTAKSAPKTPAIDPKEAAEAAKLAARRGAQVEGGKAVGTKSAQPNQSADANDEDSMFAAYANAANKRIAKRYS